jgi:hypothetical protein
MDAGAMMTLGNMRENGVRSLAITRSAIWCNSEVSVANRLCATNDLKIAKRAGARLVDLNYLQGPKET